ncbi:AMP-dependent synthetase/ligase in alkane synthesis cluster [Citrifermentans bremense]|uniref:AMP-dependent synthetase/ligase in alkane synthesis cluster n=1 Tax=Citrifermentans bremense TaxID=60035 RepID=A0A6S6M166_9BACT|nr:fatty acid CoA ligase family protein [Citrifermentans bremense]BCG47180.1 AMP-dependent synthetase/ligase in alkane synthesis cluster [Citrifermentans bremense]
MLESELVNIAAHLPEMAKRQPDTRAIIFPKQNRSLSFSELNTLSDRIARGLIANGICRGVRTVLMVTPSPEFFALTFALFKVGAVPVLIDPGLGIKNLKQCFSEAQPHAFIGIPKAHLARLIFGWGKETIRTCITVGSRLFWEGTTLKRIIDEHTDASPFVPAPTSSEDVAAILFTSGSTGVPKGAVYSHGNFAAQVQALKQVYGIEPGEIDLPTFPLFALFAPALGMTAVIPEMDFTRPGSVDPRKIIGAIQKYGVTTMFGSPALINRVGRYGVKHQVKLPTLRRAISAGAPVSAAVLERFTSLLNPGVQVFTPYGATEALPVCSIGSTEILETTRKITDAGGGVCVGRPVEGIRLEIIQISDDPICCWHESLRVPTGKIGEIVVQGEQVTKGYYNRPESDHLSKIADPETGSFFHRMGDLGGRDEEGRIWFCGRKSHRVETESGPFYTIPCEAVFNTHPAVFRTALVGVGAPGEVKPVLCVELEKDVKADPEQVRVELLALAQDHIHTKSIDTILFHPAFPVDIRHNAKIFREKLSVWAAARLK